MLGAREDNRLRKRRLTPGSVNLISGEVFHRVDIAPRSECWSLFVHAPKAGSWGFIQQRRYHDHEEVVAEASNPLWWKQAERPIRQPRMRLPCPL